MKKYLLVVLVGFCMFANANIITTVAQEAEEAEIFYSFGIVKNVTEDTIEIKEVIYDGETDTEIIEEVVYVISPETKLENAASIDDLVAGSEIDIEYVEADGKKKASYIYLYEKEYVD